MSFSLPLLSSKKTFLILWGATNSFTEFSNFSFVSSSTLVMRLLLPYFVQSQFHITFTGCNYASRCYITREYEIKTARFAHLETVSTCQSHREEIDPSGDVPSQNGGSSTTRGVKKYREMNAARGSERERKRERGVRSEKRNGKIPLYIGTCIRVGTKFRSALHRARRGRGGGDDGGSGRIDRRVWAATNPRFSSLPLSSIRSSSLHLSSTRPAHSSLLLHLSSFRFAFFVLPAPFLSLVLTARSSFLPASPFHRFVLSFHLPPSFLPSLYNHLFSSSFSFASRYAPATHIELGWLRDQFLTIVLVELLSEYRLSVWILRPERGHG